MKTRLMMFVAVIALFVFNGCSDSKESYVKDFKKFIEKVEAAGSDYTEEDWKKADEKFETFTGDRYEKFSSELTIDEQVEITKLKATYATRRGLSNLKNGVDKLLDSDILKMEKNKNTIDRLFPMENKVYRSGIRINGNEIIIAQSNSS